MSSTWSAIKRSVALGPESGGGIPFPPVELRTRVGDLSDRADELSAYDAVGRVLGELVLNAPPADWSWAGKRILDFGCGAGRVLRHLLAHDDLEVWGCDIDEASISWLKRAVGGRVGVLLVNEEPRLPLPAQRFDFIYAISVFTHLSWNWAGWMAELHRVLADDGLLLATFLGPDWLPEPARPKALRAGMTVIGDAVPWNRGGPCAVVSERWLRTHWGRGYQIVELRPSNAPAQGVALMRKRAGTVSAEEFESVPAGAHRHRRGALSEPVSCARGAPSRPAAAAR